MPTAIEWTEETWNPLGGCAIYSPGCKNCYAMRMARRLEAMGHERYAGLTQSVNGNVVWTGEVRPFPDVVGQPLRWRKPRVVFVNSMSDLFHADVPAAFIDRVFAVMACTPRHTYQVLTKRAERLREYMTDSSLPVRLQTLVLEQAWLEKGPVLISRKAAWIEANRDAILAGFRWPLPNVWLGVSAEDQQRGDERIPLLLQVPAVVRFISAEPLLGSVSLHSARCRKTGDCPACPACLGGLGWCIAGGESGEDARPAHPDWARQLRDECQRARIPFFWKQWGAWQPISEQTEAETEALYHPVPAGQPEDLYTPRCRVATRVIRYDGGGDYQSIDGRCSYLTFRVGKKRAGARLDGREWRQMPEVTRAA